MNGMNLRKKAHETAEKAQETLSDVSAASKKVVASTEWATVALVGVAAVSVIALIVGVVALNRSTRV
jgi:CHASE3 domain sensor protein